LQNQDYGFLLGQVTGQLSEIKAMMEVQALRADERYTSLEVRISRIEQLQDDIHLLAKPNGGVGRIVNNKSMSLMAIGNAAGLIILGVAGVVGA